ncbi:MAG: DUF501 domain-containing protein [Terracoccus sp.]
MSSTGRGQGSADARPGAVVSRIDLAAVELQLGRPPRGVAAVAHRCPCGQPDVLRTEPRLPDGSPFPTTYYATCPRLTGAISTLETAGMMKSMTARLGADAALAAAFQRAHEHYLARRSELGEVPEIAGVSAGGMPTRVKCLHVLVAHSLAAGPGVNPLGDEALEMLGEWWTPTSCALLHSETQTPSVTPPQTQNDGGSDGD